MVSRWRVAVTSSSSRGAIVASSLASQRAALIGALELLITGR
jgi:hypothetical protein